ELRGSLLRHRDRLERVDHPGHRAEKSEERSDVRYRRQPDQAALEPGGLDRGGRLDRLLYRFGTLFRAEKTRMEDRGDRSALRVKHSLCGLEALVVEHVVQVPLP